MPCHGIIGLRTRRITATVENDFRSYHRCGAAGVLALGVSATGTERVSRALTRAWIRNPGKFPPN